MNKCTIECCAPIEIFEDQDLARTRQCFHCEGVPLASMRDTTGKIHCSSCNCRFDIHSNDEEDQQIIGKTTVTCRIHPQCDWWDCLSRYQSHINLSPVPQFNTEPILNFNSTQPILPLPKIDQRHSQTTSQTPANKLLALQTTAADIAERLKSFIDQLTNQSHLNEMVTLLVNFTAYTKTKIDQLRKDNDINKKISGEHLFNLPTWNPAYENNSMGNELIDSMPTNIFSDILDSVTVPSNEQKTTTSQAENSKPTKPNQKQIDELMKIPTNWSDDLRSEFMWKNAKVNSIFKYYRWNISIIKQSLINFGGRKKLIARNANNDYIGLCLRGPEFCQSDDPRATKIGKEIWKVCYRNKTSNYSDNSKVREVLRVDCRKEAEELFVDFDVQTRTLTVSDYLDDECQKILVVKVLEEIDLAKVNLYFDHYMLNCDQKLHLVEFDTNKFQMASVEFETHDQTLVRNKYHSIVKAKDEGLYCYLIDKQLTPFKKYKFEFSKLTDSSTSVIGFGIFHKDKTAANHYRFNWTNGYQANCGMIAIDCKGQLMHDNQSMTTGNTTSDFLISTRDQMTVEYDSIEQEVIFHNLKTDKQITHSYPIDVGKIDEYCVGGFLGNGHGAIEIK
jgi:hypothetical protein